MDMIIVVTSRRAAGMIVHKVLKMGSSRVSAGESLGNDTCWQQYSRSIIITVITFKALKGSQCGGEVVSPLGKISL